jgi:hypothetical protein
MSIFITGDLHGDFRRFRPDIFYEQEMLTKEDTVLAAGDFGGVWFGDAQEDEKLDWLEGRPFTTAFVPGNHENYDALRKYPLAEWHGGKVRYIRPSVIMLERGQIFDLDGKKVFAMGGASSHDIQDGILEPDDPQFERKFQALDARGAAFRVNHLSWWKEELPSPEEYVEARTNLEKAGWSVDYILTHCFPTVIQTELLRDLSKPDHLTDFLNEVRHRCQFRYWFAGHYHLNTVLRNQFVVLYEQIIKLK